MCVKWNVFNSANWIMIIYFLSVTEYGLFKPDEDAKKGTWLDPRRTLEYYLFRAGVGALNPSLISMTIMIEFHSNEVLIISRYCARLEHTYHLTRSWLRHS